MEVKRLSSLFMCAGVHWGVASGLPEDHPYPAAAAGADGRSGCPAAPVRRLHRNSGPTQHHCGSGTLDLKQ